MVVSIDKKGNVLNIRENPNAKPVDLTEFVRLLAEQIMAEDRKSGSAEVSA